MERRKAIRVAGAVSLTMVAGASAMALNSGVVGADRDQEVGQIAVVDMAAYENALNFGHDTRDSTSSGLSWKPKLMPTNAEATTRSSASEVSNKRDRDDDDDHDCDELNGSDKDSRSRVIDSNGDRKSDRDHHDEKHYDGADDDD